MRTLNKVLRLTLIAFLVALNQALVTSPSLSIVHKPSLQHRRNLVLRDTQLSSSLTMSFMSLPDSTVIAQYLGYFIGTFSLLLYTPIAVRLARQRTAEGLVVSTWWLKLSSYMASDIYAFKHGYPISTYVETLIITFEAAVVLGLVVYFQRRADEKCLSLVAAFVTTSLYLLYAAPPQIVALGQGASAILNTGALIPQFLLNNKRQKAGDYSPVTAGLAATGCLVRVFTTIQLADSDALLLASFSLAFVLNSALFGQIVYLGTQVEGRSLHDVLTADVGTVVREDNLESSGNVDLTAYQMAEDIALVPLQEDIPLTDRKPREDNLPLSR
jgi:mannose-P-dolichol utilization defect protein 1